MKEGSLFCFASHAKVSLTMVFSKVIWLCFVCHVEISQTMTLHAVLFRKLLMGSGATAWFETVCSYGVEAIDY
jgi:hypothetical protein